MHKHMLTVLAVALLTAGSVAASASQASAKSHQKPITRHQHVVHPGSDITSFSSSSGLHVGVNHPPKNR
jgi:outer membrane biogenesis lipoprotein LolB